jgi:hypothetical protein
MFKHIPISNDAIWQATLAQWKSDALALGDEGVFISLDVEQRLNGLKQQTECEDNLHCYFLVKNGNGFASSILEVSHALPKSDKAWLKLLNITIQPSLLPIGDRATEIFKEAFTVLAYSISHAIELISHEHPSKELKIYGRTPEMVSLFKAIISTDVLNTVLDTFQLAIRLEGNWLVLVKVEP